MIIEQTIATAVQGRYLVVPPPGVPPAPIVVGFHGYGENAETQLERLAAVAEGRQWLLVSIQALHRFYGPLQSEVVASWMTRQGREAAIVDNLAYVSACLDAVSTRWATIPRVAFVGFSQGVAMAFRAAARSSQRVAGVVSVGGDVPPELEPAALQRISAALLVRGTRDTWYTRSQFTRDRTRLEPCCEHVRAFETDAGHEWTSEIATATSTLRTTTGDAR